MPKSLTEYRCLLISPSDVADERDALAATVERWNAQIGAALDTRVNLVRWETHGIPDMSGEPQAVLNDQIVDDCHLGIALFWSRIGTPTSTHASGSIEEIHRLLERGVKVMVYFKSSAIPRRISPCPLSHDFGPLVLGGSARRANSNRWLCGRIVPTCIGRQRSS
ncbi:MAG TPA: hypothetical protein VHC22_13365 [Pirellulales bacterium]|nr:hypothetical protein [Pirellulales bacterium]